MGSESDGNQYSSAVYLILHTIYIQRHSPDLCYTNIPAVFGSFGSGYFLFRFGSTFLQLHACNLPSYASWKLKGHRDTLDIPPSKEQLMDNVEQMSARNIPDLSRTNHVTNMLVMLVVVVVVG